MIPRTARLLALTALLAVAVLPAQAAELHDHGWWWRAQTGILFPLPPPPHVPDDALLVGSGPDGPTAIAAVRYTLDAGDNEPVLVLRVHDERGPEPQVIACPVVELWFGDRAGHWDHRPDHDCDAGAVAGVRSDDGETYEFALAPLVRGNAVDVVLRPPLGAPSIFEVVFEQPGEESLVTQRAGEAFEPPPAPPPPPPQAPPPATGARAPWEREDAPPPYPADAEDPADEPPPPAGDPGEPGEPPPAAVDEAAADAAATQGTTDRTVALVLLLAVGLLLAADLARRRVPGTATVVVAPERGLGRFRRPRDGRPTPLV